MPDIVNNYTNEQLGSAAYKDSGTASDETPLNSDLGTMALVDKQASPADTTAGRGLTTDTTHVAAGVLYTEANYQPDKDDGLNSPRWMKNISGGSHTFDVSYPAAQLQWAYATTSGVVTGSGATSPAGTWKQITGRTLASNEFGLYVRTI